MNSALEGTASCLVTMPLIERDAPVKQTKKELC